MKNNQICRYCDGQGFVEIRDCSGEIQREETCMLCGGIGILSSQDMAQEENQEVESKS